MLNHGQSVFLIERAQPQWLPNRWLFALAWAGSLVAVAGVGEFVQTIRYFAGDLSERWLGGIYPATFLFVGVCFLVLGLAFGVTAWLTRR